MNEQYYFSPERYLRDERDRKQIKVIGRVAGLCVIAYVVLQNLLTLPLVFEPLSSIYNSSPVFQDAVTILLSVFGLMLPFAIGGFYLRRRTNVNVFAFDRPVSVKLMVFAVFFGFLSASRATMLRASLFRPWTASALSSPRPTTR